MAYNENKEIDELTAVTDIDDADYLVVGDTSDAAEAAKSITWANFKTLVNTYITGLSSYFDKSTETLDDITTGSTNVHFTATDETKLDGIEASADVTDENNVVAALSGATLTDLGTPASTDKVLLQDASDSDNLKTFAYSEISGISNVVDDTTPQLGGDLDAQGNNITDLGNVTFQTGVSGGTLRTGTSNADKFVLQGYDTNLASYVDLIQADAGNTPRLQLFADNLEIEDDTDATKQVTWDLSGATTSTATDLIFSQSANRTITFPDATDTLVGKATTDTLTNKTIDADNNTVSNIGTSELSDEGVTFPKMQHIATSRILGRNTAGTGDVESLTGSTVRGITGLDTTDSPQFSEVNIGHATDTTIGRTSAGVINVEGSDVLMNSNKTGADANVVSGTAGTSGNTATWNADGDLVDGPPPTSSINFVIDGGGSAITTGVKGYIEIPFACTIDQVTLLADQTGSIVVDIWKDTYANYPPTDADSITASAVPTISSATKSQDSTLTGWTTSISAGDILGFNVDSITTCERVTLSLKVTRT